MGSGGTRPNVRGAVHGPNTPDDNRACRQKGSIRQGYGGLALFDFERDGRVETEGFVESGKRDGESSGLKVCKGEDLGR